jgi:hypothetical protein
MWGGDVTSTQVKLAIILWGYVSKVNPEHSTKYGSGVTFEIFEVDTLKTRRGILEAHHQGHFSGTAFCPLFP